MPRLNSRYTAAIARIAAATMITSVVCPARPKNPPGEVSDELVRLLVIVGRVIVPLLVTSEVVLLDAVEVEL